LAGFKIRIGGYKLQRTIRKSLLVQLGFFFYDSLYYSLVDSVGKKINDYVFLTINQC